MDLSAETRIRDLLEPGEELLWSGSPKRGILLVDITMVLVILPFLFAPLFVFAAIRSIRDPRNEFEGSGADVSVLFLVVLAGLFVLAAARNLIFTIPDEVRRRNGFIYGLTDRRAIVIAPQRKSHSGDSAAPEYVVASVTLDSISSIEVKSHLDGTGTISVESTAEKWPAPAAWQSDGKVTTQPLFGYIPSVDAVCALLKDGKRRAPHSRMT